MTETPKGWRMVTLNDLQALEPRAITDGPFGSNLARAHYTDHGARVIRLQNIGDGRFNDARAYVSMAHFEKLRAHEARAGDLVIASLGESLPRACLVPEFLGPAIVKADCIRVRLRDDVDRRWVLYAMQTPAVRRWASDQLHGVGRPRLGLKVMRALPIPLPPLVEQRRIVDILEDHLSRLDAAAQLLRDAMTRVSAHRRSYLDVLTESAARHVPLGDLIDRVEAGKSFGSSGRPAEPDEWGIIKVSAMTWGEFRPDENKLVTDVGRIDRRYEIKPNDILVSRANTTEYVGAPVLVRETRPRLLLSDKSLRLIPRPDCLPDYIVRVLSAPRARRQMSLRATGTKDSMRNISQSVLLGIEVPWVDPDDQAALVAAADNADSYVDRVRRSAEDGLARSRVLRRALLKAAFSGRLTGASSDTEIIEELAGA